MTLPNSLDEAIARIEAMSDTAVEAESNEDFGRFEGLPLQMEWSEEAERVGKLLRALAYLSADDDRWAVPVGAWLDGASIPRAFWSIIGGPYEGKYREASVAHDHYCITQSRTWRDTHRMFYSAMRCRGVNPFKARMMFYAVYRFGPRWADPGSLAEAAARAPDIATDAKAEQVLRDAEIILASAPSVSQIEQLADGARAGDILP